MKPDFLVKTLIYSSRCFQEYDDDSSEEDVYSGEPPNKINDLKIYPKKKGKHKKRKKPSSSEEDDSSGGAGGDAGGGMFSGFAMPNVGKYFEKTFDSFGEYVPSFPMFGEDSEEDSGEYDDETMERVPKLKNSLSNYFKMKRRQSTENVQEKNKEKSKRWYDKFFFGSDEAAITAPPPVTTTTTESPFFPMNWFGSKDSTESTESAPVHTSTQPQSKIV